MEVVLSFAICNVVEHDLGLDVNASTLSNEDTLQSLKHFEDVDRVHTSILVVIAQLEHKLDLLVLLNSGQQVATK